VADVNWVSDFDYFSDFERSLDLVSSPTILARLEFSRNGPWTSINVRELRREQLLTDGTRLVQQTLPEVEWRGRSRRLGKTPFYLSFLSSIASIQQPEKGADYYRGDLFPALSMPLLQRVSWLDVTPRVSYRMTYYTQSRDASGATLDANLYRLTGNAGIDIIGPKFYRIYDRPNSSFSPQLKHTIEAQIQYGYQKAFDDKDNILIYDEVDASPGAGNAVRYGLVQRLFAKRPRARPASSTSTETILMPGGTTTEVEGAMIDEAPADEEPRVEDDEEQKLEPIEIASFELRQFRSFDAVLSREDFDGDGVNEMTSRYSDLSVLGRFNPNPRTSVDLRGTYNVLYNTFETVSVSGAVRRHLAGVRFSLVYNNGLGLQEVDPGVLEPRENTTQARVTTGVGLFRNRLQLAIDGAYTANPSPGQKHVPDLRWRVQYSTQCCTFLLERLRRDYSTTGRNDLYFRVDLKGVGKILKVSY